MHKLTKKLLDEGRADALKSVEALQSAAEELGFDAEDVAAALEELGELPLSDEALQEATGGKSPKPAHSLRPYQPELRVKL